MKKLFVTITIIVVILALGFLGWQILSRDSETSVGEVVRNVLPFGTGEGLDIPFIPQPETPSESSFLNEAGSPTSNLFILSSAPVSGMTVLERGGETVVRYAERATGHIQDIVLPETIGEDPLRRIRVTNTTIPKVYEAVFRPDGGAVLFRSLVDDSDLIENRALTLTPPTSTSTEALHSISSLNITTNISSVSPLGNNLIYFSKSNNSFATQAYNGTGLRTILASPFRDWRVAAFGNSALIHTKASFASPGYAYTLNTTNGALTKIAGPLQGLVAIPGPSNRVLYSYVDGGFTRLVSRNISSNSSYEINPYTLAEKCVWSTRNTGILFCGAPSEDIGFGEPDNWYQGKTNFSDRIWLHDTEEQIAQVLVEPKGFYDLDLDVYQPKLSPSEDYLIFINKIDLSLWAFKLEIEI